MAPDVAEEDLLGYAFGGNERYPIPDGSPAEVTAELASLLQDEVIDELGSAWPVCPGHPHPMVAGWRDEMPVWRCPTDPTTSVPIGKLGGSPPGG